MSLIEAGINFEGLINKDSILEWLMSIGILYEKNQKAPEKKKEKRGWFSRKPSRKGADQKQNPPAQRSHGADKQ